MATQPFRPTQREILEYERAITKWLSLAPHQQNLFVENIARQMIGRLLLRNRSNWQTILRGKKLGLALHQGIQQELRGPLGTRVLELLSENTRLIQGLPVELAQRTSAYIAEQQRNGARAEEIEKTLKRRLPQMAKSRIRLIARTEVGKAETALTQARAENLGLTHYVWRTSEDSRVRLSHRKMDGVIVAFSDPPAPEQIIGETSTLGHYHAGASPNCRCICLPLVNLDEVKWPAKVVRYDRIERMTRTQFSRTIPQMSVAA